MERREFLKSSAAFCLMAGSFSLTGCMNYKYITAEEENRKLKVKRSDLENSNWAVVKSERSNTPVFLSKNEIGTYDAVLMLCTHRQCEVKPTGKILACPCHGAEFSFKGKVLKEPAEKDLTQFTTSTDDNFIYVHLQ